MNVTISDKDYFAKITSILNKERVNYWLDQGTLLGLVRDGKLISWEWDIDFGVFENEISRERLIAAFLEEGFTQEKLPPEHSCLHFIYSGQRKVDITLYSKVGEYAAAKFLTPVDGLYPKLRRFVFTHVITDYDSVEGYGFPKRIIAAFLTLLKMILALNKKLLNKVKLFAQQRVEKKPIYNIVYHRIPLEILSKTSNISFLGSETRIPQRAEDYLVITYGTDWKTPKREWVWFKEGTNNVVNSL